MYGLIGKMRAAEGKRDALIDLMLQGTAEMPGCLSYIVARDPNDPDAIWITEVWTDEASHQASSPSLRCALRSKGHAAHCGLRAWHGDRAGRRRRANVDVKAQ